MWQWISRFSTLFVHHSEKIFRQIISLVISLAKPYLSRIFYQTCVSVNFWNYHTVCIPHCGNTGNLPPLQKSFVKSIHSVTLTKFLQKNVGEKYSNIHTVHTSVWKLQKSTLTGVCIAFGRIKEIIFFFFHFSTLYVWPQSCKYLHRLSFSTYCYLIAKMH